MSAYIEELETEEYLQAGSGRAVLTFPNPQQISLSVRASALVFADPESQKLLSLIERVAPSEATILIKGETGTGKELVARHIHSLSKRKNGPFAAINCGAFSETLVESELFGYERGAFTGAVGAKPGWFETANGGTLFLDEIGDLPMSTQVKLLRVLQEREIIRVGARKTTPIDVRLVAASNVDLKEAVRAGRFREDLFYRINVVPLQLSPLRDRPGDILPLIKHFISVYTKRLHIKEPTILPETLRALSEYPWPGNIRELENLIHRALLVCEGEVLRPNNLNLPVIREHEHEYAAPKAAVTNDHVVEDDFGSVKKAFAKLFETEPESLYDTINNTLIVQAYHHARENQVQTAKLLGISRNVLRNQLKHLGLIV